MVDAMSSFAGVPIDTERCGIDIIISSANKCIQGVPGFGFILVRRSLMESWKGQARSLSLDAYAQWRTMEDGGGKWRYTSPTHVVRAFAQALQELETEGGILARSRRYHENHNILVTGMRQLGYETLIPDALQSPIITSFYNPPVFEFRTFYEYLKTEGFVIYPGKVSAADCFRIGTIGDVFPPDIHALLKAIRDAQK
jgi:2-aminoethylphosphonate-pyruvate transaminase